MDRDAVELAAIEKQDRTFRWLAWLTIGVSFVHMSSALMLFSEASWLHWIAAGLMTLMIDLSTAALAGYLFYVKRRRRVPSRWVTVCFGFGLLIGVGLNGAYMWANRPAEQVIPFAVSAAISVTFATFVPAVIGIASLIRGELEDDRTDAMKRQAKGVVRVLSPETPALRSFSAGSSGKRFIASQGSNERYNHKTAIATNDVAAIAERLQDAGVRGTITMRELRDVCGWSSSSSSFAAKQHLLDAGIVDITEDGMRIVPERLANAAKGRV